MHLQVRIATARALASLGADEIRTLDVLLSPPVAPASFEATTVVPAASALATLPGLPPVLATPEAVNPTSEPPSFKPDASLSLPPLSAGKVASAAPPASQQDEQSRLPALPSAQLADDSSVLAANMATGSGPSSAAGASAVLTSPAVEPLPAAASKLGAREAAAGTVQLEASHLSAAAAAAAAAAEAGAAHDSVAGSVSQGAGVVRVDPETLADCRQVSVRVV